MKLFKVWVPIGAFVETEVLWVAEESIQKVTEQYPTATKIKQITNNLYGKSSEEAG